MPPRPMGRMAGTVRNPGRGINGVRLRPAGVRRPVAPVRVARGLRIRRSGRRFLAGGGCPWRLPSVDHEWATNGMRALGLPADRFEDNAIVLARLLDGQSGDYELASGRMPETPDTAYGSDADRFVVVEQFHNAFRRITTDWDSVLNRRTMDSNLERLLPLAAHTVRIEREGGSPDLRPMLDLCRKTHKAANRRTNRIAGEPDGPEHGYDVLP